MDKKAYLEERNQFGFINELEKIAQDDEDEDLNAAADYIAESMMSQRPQQQVYDSLMPTFAVIPQQDQVPSLTPIAPFDPEYYDDPVAPDLGGETWGLGGGQMGEY